MALVSDLAQKALCPMLQPAATDVLTALVWYRTRGAPTANTGREATGGLSGHQTPFAPHNMRYEPSETLRMP